MLLHLEITRSHGSSRRSHGSFRAPALSIRVQDTVKPAALLLQASTAQCSAVTAGFDNNTAVVRSGTLQPKLLTYTLTRCSTIAEVIRTCSSYDKQLNAIHISAALSRCVKLARQRQALMQTTRFGHCPQVQKMTPASGVQLLHPTLSSSTSASQQQLQQWQPLHEFVSWALERLLSEQPLCSSREFSTVLWCCAKLQYSPEPQILDKLLSRFADVMSGSTSQALSVVLYSLAKLGYHPGQTWLDQVLLRLFKSVIANQRTVWPVVSGRACSFSPTQQQQHPQGSERLVEQGTSLPQQQHLYSSHNFVHYHQQLDGASPAHQLYSDSQQQILHQLRQCYSIGQVLSNTIWSLARLQQHTAAEVWLLPLLSLLCSQQQQQQQLVQAPGSLVSMQSVANVLWACGRLLPARSPAAADLSSSPIGLLQQHWQHQLGFSSWDSRLQSSRSSSRRALVAAVQLKAATLLESCMQQLHTAQPQELVMLMHSCMFLDLTPSRQWQQQYWAVSTAVIRQQHDCYNIDECVSMLFSTAYLRMRPSGMWFAAVLSRVQHTLHTATADQVSKVVWALGTLRARPPVNWMSTVVGQFVAQLQSQLQRQQQMQEGQKQQGSSISAAAVSMLVWGASKIGYQPPTASMEMVLQAVTDDLVAYGPHQLSKLLHGCSVLHLQLPEPWVHSIIAAFNQQPQQCTAADITMLMRALAGIRRQQRGQQPQPMQDKHKQRLQWQQQQSGTNAVRSFAAVPSATQSTAAVSDQQQLQHSDSEEINAILARAEQLLGYMTATELCQALYAAASMDVTLGSLAWSQAVNYTLPRQLHLLSPGDLSLLLYSMARLQHAVHPRRALHKQVLLHSYRMLAAGRYHPRDMTAFVWNYWRVFKGRLCTQQVVVPRQWVAVFTQAAGTRLHDFTGRQLGVMLKGLLLIGAAVDQQFLDMASAAVETRSASYDKYELAMVSSVLLQLQQARLAARRVEALVPEQQQWPEQQQRQERQQQHVLTKVGAAAHVAAATQGPWVASLLQNGVVPIRGVAASAAVADDADELAEYRPEGRALLSAVATHARATSRVVAASDTKVAVVARAGRQ